MTQENKGCCEKCRHHYFKNSCINSYCPCHKGKELLPNPEDDGPNAIGNKPTDTKGKEDWSARFDERVSKERFTEYSKDKLGCCGGDYCEGDHNANIKAFIAEEIARVEEKHADDYYNGIMQGLKDGKARTIAEIKGVVEGMRKEESNLAGFSQIDLTYERERAFNAALTDLLAHLNKMEGE